MVQETKRPEVVVAGARKAPAAPRRRKTDRELPLNKPISLYMTVKDYMYLYPIRCLDDIE